MGRGPNWTKLYKRQADAGPRIVANLEATRDAPRVTLERLLELVAEAKASGADTFELTIKRQDKPARGRPIRLTVWVDGKCKTGPWSSEDHPVVRAGGHNWTTHWRTRDCELWLEKAEQRR